MRKSIYSASLLAALGLQLFSLAPAWSAETVKSGAVNSKSKVAEDGPTAEEKAMGAVASPFKMCSNLLMVESSGWNNNQKYWKNYKSNCEASGGANCSKIPQTIPDTGVFKSFDAKAGVNLSSNVSTIAFLQKVADRSISKLSADISKREKMIGCLNGAKSAGCDGVADDTARIRKGVTDNIKAFREATAYFIDPSKELLNRVIASGDTSVLVNKTLSPVVGRALMPEDAPPLSDSEFKKVKEDWDRVLAKAKAEWNSEIDEMIAKQGLTGGAATAERDRLLKPENFATKLRRSIAEKQKEQQDKYLALLQENQELGYIGDPKADSSKLAAAISKLIADSKERLEVFKEARKLPTKRSVDSKDVESGLMTFATHTTIIDEILTEEQKKGGASSCAVATALSNAVAASELRVTLGVTAALVGVPVALAVAGGAVPAAVAGSVGGIAFGVKMGMDDEARVKDAYAGVKAVDEEFLKAFNNPMGLSVMSNVIMDGPLMKAGAGVAAGAYALAKTGALRLARRSALEGASSSSAKSLSALAKSASAGDEAAMKTLATKGMDEAKKVLGHAPTQEEALAIKSLDEKGVMSPTLLESYGDAVKGVPAEQQKMIAKNMSEIAASLPAAKELGSPDRVEAVQALIPLIAKEAPDVKATSAILKAKDWTTDSLQGLGEVLKSMKNYVGDKVKKYLAALDSVAKKAGVILDDSKRAVMCQCPGFCPRPVGALEQLTGAAPKYVACAAP